MTRAELSKLIEQALLQDINLSEEEYKEKLKASDKQTEINGYVGKASLDERVRARRMSMNFYGMVMNTLLNMHATNLEMLAEQKKTNYLLSALMSGEENGDK